jgi:hypothetical protein
MGGCVDKVWLGCSVLFFFVTVSPLSERSGCLSGGDIFLEETKMKNLTLTLMGLTVLSMGCKKDCDTADTNCDTGSADADADADAATFAVTWGSSSVDAVVTNADMTNGYFFGMAETGAGATGWYGEDCQDDTDGAICHDFYDELFLACVTTIEEVEANVATLHCAAESDTSWAFWGFDGTSYEDLVSTGGDDPSYFGG